MTYYQNIQQDSLAVLTLSQDLTKEAAETALHLKDILDTCTLALSEFKAGDDDAGIRLLSEANDLEYNLLGSTDMVDRFAKTLGVADELEDYEERVMSLAHGPADGHG